MFAAALSGAPARRFFAAHAQSCLGSGLAAVALSLLAYDRFQNAWAIAAVLVPDLLPAIVLGPLLGALVDRIGWRVCAVVADVLRCVAFLVILLADSLPLMIVGALIAGIGNALFGPSALSGLPRLLRGERGRAAGLGLYSAIDDLGLTAGPALASVALAVVSPAALLGFNALTFAVSAALLVGVRVDGGGDVAARGGATLLADARAGVRELAGRPEIRTLLLASTGVVLCIGVTNVGEVFLAREVLGVGGSGLALMVAAGGLGTVLGSLCTRFTSGRAWLWRRAYAIGLAAMAVDLFVCALAGSIWLIVPALALGGFGNGLALVHDRMLLSRSAPETLHGRLFGLQKTCVSFAFAVSFLCSGALISGVGVRGAFLVMAAGLALVMVTALPRLRAAWPTPPSGRPPALGDALA